MILFLNSSTQDNADGAVLAFLGVPAAGVVAYKDRAAAAQRRSYAARTLASRDKNSDELVEEHSSENQAPIDRMELM